jgi:regulatory protein
MRIEQIKAITKTKCEVHLEDGTTFSLYKGEASRYHLREGEELSEEVYQELLQEILIKRAKKRAMHLLEKMDRSRASLADKLRQSGYPEEAVQEALRYVTSFGYLDDERFAMHYVQTRMESKSKRELSAKLYEKGISRDIADAVLERCYEFQDESEAILRAIRKKNIDLSTATNDEKYKLFAYLARKGFAYDDIRQVIQMSMENA